MALEKLDNLKHLYLHAWRWCMFQTCCDFTWVCFAHSCMTGICKMNKHKVAACVILTDKWQMDSSDILELRMGLQHIPQSYTALKYTKLNELLSFYYSPYTRVLQSVLFNPNTRIQFWSSTSFGHICFTILLGYGQGFILTSLEMFGHSGLRTQQISWINLLFYF